MGWPLSGLLGVWFFISPPVPSAAEAARRVGGPGGVGESPAAGSTPIERREATPAEVLGEGRGDRPGEPGGRPGRLAGLGQSAQLATKGKWK